MWICRGLFDQWQFLPPACFEFWCDERQVRHILEFVFTMTSTLLRSVDNTNLAQVQSSQYLSPLLTLIIRQTPTVRFKESLLPMTIPPQFMQITVNDGF